MVRIHLPGTQHAKQAELNVESQQLTLTVAGKYHLQLPLPHRVIAAEGTASFNSGKQQLEVVLPVIPSAPSAATAKPPPPQQQQAEEETQYQDRGANNAHELSDSIHEPESAAASSACVDPPPGKAAPKGNQLPDAGHSQHDGDAVPQEASDRLATEPLTANQRKWQELHPKASSSQDSPMQVSTSHVSAAADADTLRVAAAAGRCCWCAVTFSCCIPVGSQAARFHHTDCCTDKSSCAAQAGSIIVLHHRLWIPQSVLHVVTRCHLMCTGDTFIASATFGGQLPGYVFTSRSQGVGYYKDASMAQKAHTHEAEASNTAQAMPESNALPVVLKPRLRTRAAAEELD